MKIPIFAYQKPAEPAKGAPNSAAKRASPTQVILTTTLAGVLFGCCFPVISALIVVLGSGLPFRLASFFAIQRGNPLLWIIDTAPLFLGLFSYFAGRYHASSLKLNEDLQFSLDERAELVSQLETLSAHLGEEVDKRINQLKTTAQVAQEANLIRDLDQLLSRTANLISERFGFYHVGIFLLDARGEYAELKASNSSGGQRMLERGHRLKVGEVGIVGDVAAKGSPRIALDVTKERVYFDNPDLTETRSEMALPIRTGKKIIGVLDIQSTEHGAFDQNDAITLQISADSLGSAIENAHLFSETQANLEEIQALHRQYLKRAWSETAQAKGGLEYTFVSPAPASAPDPATARVLNVPIQLRDQVIGNLTLEAKGRSLSEAGGWTLEEMALVEAIANQAAQALENTRLLEEAQETVEQERLSARISGKVLSSRDIETILSTALQELGSSLRASEGLIQLEIRE